MKKLTLLLAMITPLVACSTGVGPQKGVINETARRITLHIEVDTKGVPLGAYQIVIHWDQAEARIVDVHRPQGSDFQGEPKYDLGTFTKGATRITGYSLRQPAAIVPYRLVSVVFEQLQLGAARSPVSVKVERLYDTSRPPKEIARHDVTPSRPALDFTVPD